MSRKIRERTEMKWWAMYLAQYNKVPPSEFDAPTMIEFIDGIIDHLEPQIMRTPDDKMAEALKKIQEAIVILEEGVGLGVTDALKVGGLDPESRSDKTRTRLFLNECGLLQRTGGHQPELWFKRITGPKANGSETGDDANN